MNFYKHHIGDFDQATRHLSFVEDAAYSRMIRKYYAEEKVLPMDVKKIERLIGARTKEEKAAVMMVLEEFFELQDDGWHNKRCDEELAKANVQAEVNRKIALDREAKKRARLEHEQSTVRDTQEHDSWSDDVAGNASTSNRQKTFSEKFPNEHAKVIPANPRQMGNVEHDSWSSREPSQTPDTRLQTPDLTPVAEITHASGARRARPSELSAAMRRHSIEAQPGDPRIIAAAEAGVTVATIEAACAQAKAAKPNERIPPNYVVTIAMNWTADAAAPRPLQARSSPTNARDESRRHAYEVLTGKTAGPQSEPAEVINGHIKLIG